MGLIFNSVIVVLTFQSALAQAGKKDLLDLPVGNPTVLYFRGDRTVYKMNLVSPENIHVTNRKKFFTNSYALNDQASRLNLANDISKLLEIYKDHKDDKKPLAFDLAKDVKKGLEYIQVLNQKMIDTQVIDPDDVEKIYEVAQAINLNYQNAVFPKVELGGLQKYVFGGVTSKLGEHAVSAEPTDRSRDGDPADSTFWQKPRVREQDLYVGFSRDALPDYAKTLFVYKKAKTGLGTHPGFRTEFAKEEYKIRLGAEHRIAPFAARILHALGFNALPIDNVKILRVKYDRDIIKEYNSRTPLPFDFTVAGFDAFSYHFKKTNDPFEFITKAILKDGREISGAELKTKLIPTYAVGFEKGQITDDSVYASAFEKNIDELQFHSASIEKLDDDSVSVGPWDWNDRRHLYHTEIRGFGLLAAWLGNYDVRPENTRLHLIKTKDDRMVLRHYVTDVGIGLGRPIPPIRTTRGDLGTFSPDLVKPKRGDLIATEYRSFTQNAAFEAASVLDVHWMLGYIEQLSEKQIRDALRAAGFNSEEENGFYRKLKERAQSTRLRVNEILR